MPTGGQCSSSYLVSTSSTRILLDCGIGAATAFSAFGHPATLDAVFISHMHIDHCYDLLPMGKGLLTGRIAKASDFPTLSADHFIVPKPLRLYVPAGATATLRALAQLFPVATIPVLDMAFSVGFDVHEYLPGDSFSVGDCTVSMHELRHAMPNCGTRVENSDGVIAYTGDTGMTDELVTFARDADLLLCEATLERPDGGNHGHLCASQAGEVARDAGVRELALTHFVTDDRDWLNARGVEAAGVFDNPVHIAQPGRHFDVSRVARRVVASRPSTRNRLAVDDR
jgi:ribonuclease BN (tRNA processing enzyme)